MRCSLHKLLWTIVYCEFVVFIANDIQASYTAQFKYIHFGLVLLCYLIFLTLFTGFSGKQPPQVFCKDATVNRGMKISIQLFTIFVIIFGSYDLECTAFAISQVVLDIYSSKEKIQFWRLPNCSTILVIFKHNIVHLWKTPCLMQNMAHN